MIPPTQPIHPGAAGRGAPPVPVPWPAILLLSVIGALLMVAWYRHTAGPGYPLDDSWIHLAFARHLAGGDGFGINPGQASTGSTSPLWTLVLAAGFLLGATHETWPWVVGALCLAASGFAGAMALRALLAGVPEKGKAWQLAMAAGVPAVSLLIVFSRGMAWSAAGAMEVPLFAALLLWAWAVHARRGGGLWGLPAGLATLARPEGFLFVILLAVTSRPPRRAAVNLSLALLCYAPYGLFCLLASGRPLPGTFYAKTTRAVAGLPDIAYVAKAAGLLWQVAAPGCLLFLAGLLAGLIARRFHATSWRTLLPGVLFPVALVAAYAAMGRTFLFAGGAGNFGRYLYPLSPFLAVAGMWGLLQLVTLHRAHSAARRVAVTFLCGVIVALVVWQAASGRAHARFFAHNVRDIQAMQVAMAGRLDERLPAGSWVAANDVGALSYLTELRVLDLVGIVSPEVQAALFPLRGREGAVRERALFDVIVAKQPLAIVVFPRWYPAILRSLDPLLEPLEEIHVPGNITSAHDRLIASRIHWERAAPSERPQGR